MDKTKEKDRPKNSNSHFPPIKSMTKMFYRLTSRSFQGIRRHSARGKELVSTSQFFLDGDIVKAKDHISNPFGAAPHVRFFSSQRHHETPMLSTTGYPQYNIYGGDTHFLGIKLIAPTFRSLKDGAIVPLQNGKFLLEFIPRDSKSVHWTEKVSIGLSAEEVGLICSELPRNTVEISRPSKNQQQENNYEASATANDYSKILTMSPGENSSVMFKLAVLSQPNNEVQDTPVRKYFHLCILFLILIDFFRALETQIL
jgi:Whirly transcription factor